MFVNRTAIGVLFFTCLLPVLSCTISLTIFHTSRAEIGGFRSDKLKQRLQETANIPARQLVVKDAPIAAKEKGSSNAFVVDDCTVM
jgi:hypothetical protein